MVDPYVNVFAKIQTRQLDPITSRATFRTTHLVIVGLRFVHHPSDSVFNDGRPNNSPLGDRDSIPGLVQIKIKNIEAESQNLEEAA